MAIIKKLKRLGSTIRGAVSGNIAIFDKDGNVVDSGRKATNYLPQILNTSRGKYLRVKSNQNIAEWGDVNEVPEIEESDVGDILYAGESGPYWGNAPGYIEDHTEELTYATEFDSWVDNNIQEIINLSYQFLKIGEFQYNLTLRMQMANDITLVSDNDTIDMFNLPNGLQNKLLLVPQCERSTLNQDGQTLVHEPVNAFSYDDVFNIDTYGHIIVDDKIKLRGYKGIAMYALADGAVIINATFVKIV